MTDCIFCKIAAGEISVPVVYEDDYVLSFPDKYPEKPVHLLVIPKKHITEFIAIDDFEIFSRMACAAKKLIHEKDIHNKGYKITFNGGGLQDIDHLHMHILGPMKK